MRKGVRLAAISVLSASLTGCYLSDPVPFDPRSLQRPEKSAAAESREPYLPGLPTGLEPIDATTQPAASNPTSLPSGRRRRMMAPTTRATTGPALNDFTMLRVPLQELVHRAVLNSHEVRVAGYDAAVSKTRILEAQAHYDPVFFSKTTYTDQKILSPSSGILPGVNPFQPEIFRTLDAQVGVRQNLPSGGQVELRYDVQRIQRVPISSGELNPYTVNDLALQVTQPLLREFGYDVNWARITLARNDYRVSVIESRKTLEENLAEIERDYWQLVEAEQEEKIQEDLLALSTATYNILVEHVGTDVSRVQLRQAETTINARAAVLVRAKARMQDISDDIKRRMNDPDFPVAGEVVILPEAPSAEIPVHFDLQDQIATALANRFELGEQVIRQESASLAMMVAKNNLLPKLDLVGTLDVQGPGKDFSHSFQNQGRSDYLGASIGFNFEWPLGNREARAIYRRAVLQRLQAMEQYATLVAQVVMDVKQAAREVETTWNEIGARRQARFAAADALQALEDRREAGGPGYYEPTNIQLVLDAQERKGDAQREEALAVASYYVAIARLERAKGTLLKYDNVVMEEEPFRQMDR
jgi:outer membrane protein